MILPLEVICLLPVQRLINNYSDPSTFSFLNGDDATSTLKLTRTVTGKPHVLKEPRGQALKTRLQITTTIDRPNRYQVKIARSAYFK